MKMRTCGHLTRFKPSVVGTLVAMTIGSIVMASDCGHPPRLHKCDEKMRFRVVREQNIPLGPIESSARPAIEVLIYNALKQNTSCFDATYTFAYTQQKTNGYQVSATGGGGIAYELGVGTSRILPVILEAKVKANASFLITGELSRQEVVGFSWTTEQVVPPRWKVGIKVYWKTIDARASQVWGDRMICDIQGGGEGNVTICNKRTIKVKANGTASIRDESASAYRPGCCPGGPAGG